MAIFMRVLNDANMQVVTGEAVEYDINYRKIVIQSAISALIATTIKKAADAIIQLPKRTVVSVEVDNKGESTGTIKTDIPTNNAFIDEVKKQLKLALQETSTLKTQYDAANKKAEKAEKQASERPKDAGLQVKAERLRLSATELSQALALKDAAITAFKTVLKK